MPAIYNFNLVSVLDTELVKLYFNGNNINSSLIDEAKSIFNYIVDREETASRIHFCTIKQFSNCLNSYDKLHSLNQDFFISLCKQFYERVFAPKRSEFLLPDFEAATIPELLKHSLINYGFREKLEHYHYISLSPEDVLEIVVPKGFADTFNKLMTDYRIEWIVKYNLQRIFHYDGQFKFVDRGLFSRK